MTETSKITELEKSKLICPECNQEFEEECGMQCEGCDSTVCEDCISSCNSCGSNYCLSCADDCLASCSECGERFCESCGDIVFDDSIEAEKFGAESTCEDCRRSSKRRRYSRW